MLGERERHEKRVEVDVKWRRKKVARGGVLWEGKIMPKAVREVKRQCWEQEKKEKERGRRGVQPIETKKASFFTQPSKGTQLSSGEPEEGGQTTNREEN